MNAAQGILTARGGMTSHAAVVARGMGKPCVAGCERHHGRTRSTATSSPRDLKVQRGDFITLDGSTGDVMLGEAKLIQPELSGDFPQLMTWADKCRKIGVRANADTPKDAKVTKPFGGEGIGLCRTEHMFFEGDRIDAVREMILADDLEGRKKALAKLLPMQKQDFKGHPGDHGEPARDHPHPGPAAARVPAQDRRGHAGPVQEERHDGRADQGQGGQHARVQPHAGLPRLPPGNRVPRDHRDAGPGHLRGRL